MMNRRVLLRNLFLWGSAGYLPKITSARKPVATTRSDDSFHSFRLGDLELTVLTDGALHMTPVQPNFAAGEPSSTVDSLLKEKFRPTAEVVLGVNILAIRDGNRLILIDSGCGPNFGSGCGWLFSSLHAAGLRTDEVTDIIITHAHPDHIGGLLQPDHSLAFPNADIHLSGTEYQFWSQDAPDFSHSHLKDSELLRQIIPATRAALQTLKPRLKFFEDGDQRWNCIRLERAAGHTPGHTLVHIYSRGEEIVHIADLLHSDALQFAHPEWHFYADTDFQQASVTRDKVLGKLSAAGTKIFAYHLPWPGIGHARRKEKGYEWVAEAYPY